VRIVKEHVLHCLGTPGGVLDMISRKALRTYDIKMFVIDEADEMLSSKDFNLFHFFRHLNSTIQVNLIK
jgi:translation initiation factor 4A